MNKLTVFEKIDKTLSKSPLIVCISGRSCSGKTTFAKEIAEKFHGTSISEDNWYKDLKNIPRNHEGYYNMECEEAFHIEEFKEDITKLRTTNSCTIPIYNVNENKRMEGRIKVNSSSLIVLEGLHTVDIFKYLDSVACVLYVYMDTPFEVCLNRRVHRDSQLYNIGLNKIIDHYIGVVDKNYNPYIYLQRDIVKRKGSWGVILDE